MVDLARRNGWHWDAILGAEVARDYKPQPVVYLASAAALDCAPEDVMMVAAHSSDLAAAAATGMRTAFIARPDEKGPGKGEHAATGAGRRVGAGPGRPGRTPRLNCPACCAPRR